MCEEIIVTRVEKYELKIIIQYFLKFFPKLYFML